MTPEKRPAEEQEENSQTAKKLKEGEENGAAEAKNENEPETESSNGNSEKTIDRKFPKEKCGSMLFCGCCQWEFIGRRNFQGIQTMQHYTPKIVKSMQGIEVGLVVSHCTSAHSVIITSEGKAMTFGRNEKGQLGTGDLEPGPKPAYVEKLKDEVIIDAACGKNHSLFLTEGKEVYACGDNKAGQCGIGKTNPNVMVPTKINFKDGPIKKISAGSDFSIVLDSRGYLFSFGSPEYGQLGHNTDGKYFVSSNKMTFNYETSPKRIPMFIERSKDGHPTPVTDVQIVTFSCGANHTVAVDKHKRAFSWGFGGYGRLGHSEPKDEYIPRQIKFFEGNKRGLLKAYCGGAYTIGVSELGTYLWGQTKRTGEANMYPKPLQDLYGWNIRAIGTSTTSVVLAADESVISWGPSPTYGELGLGDNTKSSTTAKEVKSLDGAHIAQVSCGQGHTLMVMRNETENDKKIYGKLKIADI